MSNNAVELKNLHDMGCTPFATKEEFYQENTKGSLGKKSNIVVQNSICKIGNQLANFPLTNSTIKTHFGIRFPSNGKHKIVYHRKKEASKRTLTEPNEETTQINDTQNIKTTNLLINKHNLRYLPSIVTSNNSRIRAKAMHSFTPSSQLDKYVTYEQRKSHNELLNGTSAHDNKPIYIGVRNNLTSKNLKANKLCIKNFSIFDDYNAANCKQVTLKKLHKFRQGRSMSLLEKKDKLKPIINEFKKIFHPNGQNDTGSNKKTNPMAFILANRLSYLKRFKIHKHIIANWQFC